MKDLSKYYLNVLALFMSLKIQNLFIFLIVSLIHIHI